MLNSKHRQAILMGCFSGWRLDSMDLIKRRRGLQSSLTPYIFVAPAIILLIILMLVPIVMVIWYSFFDKVVVAKNSNFVGFANYMNVFKDDVFWVSIWNTTYYTIISVVFHLLLGLVFALMLNSDLIPGALRNLMRVLFILPWVLTVTIVAIVWRLLLSPDGIINYVLMGAHILSEKYAWFSEIDLAMPALIFVNIWSGYPYYMVTLLAGLQGISKDYYEAATLDGCNGWQKFWYITLPQLKPILLSTSMLDIILTMRVFALVWTVTGGGPGTSTEVMGTYIYKDAFSRLDFAKASTSSVIILVLSMIISYFYIKLQRAREE